MTDQVPVVRAPFDDSDWDVSFRSSDNVLFRLHKKILQKASPVFEGMFSLPADPDHADDRQIVDITEESHTMDSLLRLCYPVPHPVITKADELLLLLEALRKYEMQQFAPFLEHAMLGMLENKTVDPLRAYALAYLYRMKRVAEAAARRLLDHGALEPASMPPEYDDIPASAIWILVRYRRQCRRVADDAVDNARWMATECPSRRVSISNKGNVLDVTGSWAWVTCKDPIHASDGRYVEVTSRASLPVCKWWVAYNAAAKEALESSSNGEVVTRPAVLQPAVEQAAACGKCSVRAWKELVEYSQLLAKRIDMLTSSVHLSLPF